MSKYMNKMVPDYRPLNVNVYVPACMFASDVEQDTGTVRVSLGTPSLAVANAIYNDLSVTAAASTTVDVTNDARFGRCVTVVGSGADTDAFTIEGRDYLGQPMKETVTLAGAVPVVTLKAFKKVTKLTNLAESGVTVDVGWSDKLGLPYKALTVLSEEADGVNVSSLGTIVAPVLTDPATATTGDPRGTYDPTTTLDGAKEITVTLRVSNSTNASGNGGLYGIAHYFA